MTRQLWASIALMVSWAAYAQQTSAPVSAWGWDGEGQLGDGGTTYYSSTPVQVSGLTGVVAVSGGSYHSLAVKSNGTVWAWGGNGEGELGNGTISTYNSTPVQVSGLTGVIAASTAYSHSMALESNGTVWAWGDNIYGELGNGTTSNYSATPVQVSGLTNVVAIAAGNDYSLALKSDGTVWAWGENNDGQLGNGNTTNSSVPVQVGSFTGGTAIAAGGGQSLAVKSGGTVWAWGNNAVGQLGNGTATNSNTAIQTSGLTGGVSVAAGLNFSLALKNDGTVWAWGSNAFEGSGFGIASGTPAQVTGLTGQTAIAAGSYHVLTLKNDGTVWTMGYNNYGQLGNGTTSATTTPAQVSGITGAMAVASGASHSLVVKNDGTVWAWGWNGFGQLGNGTAPFSTTPVPVLSLTDVVAVAGGTSSGLAVKGDGTVWDWGLNTIGQLGNGLTMNSSTPVQVSGLTSVKSVAAGTSHNLALQANGTVWAWGNNAYGELGNGTITNYNSTPVQVTGLTNVVAVGAGQFYSMALESNGTVWAWGINNYGQLGNGSTSNSSTPVQVSGLSGVTAIAVGYYHSLAVSGGAVWAWGYNAFGQLGNGNTTNSSTPVQVSGLTGVVAVAGGNYHSVALESNGTVWDWGDDNDGQLGNGIEGTPGSFTISSTPVQANGLSGVTAIAAGGYHNLALTSGGAVWIWGWNGYGQLGNGTYADSTTPIQVGGLTGVASIGAGEYHSLASLTPPPPALSISKTHTGSFAPGQSGVYTVVVSNAAGAAPTSGLMTVTETPPSGLTLASMTGSGWACGNNTCTRSDSLGPGLGFAAITVTVYVGVNATSPQINAVSVSGGGSASANATDSTTITPLPANLGITKTHTGNFTQGQSGAYTVTVTNAVGAGGTSGLVTVTEMPPSGLTLASMSGIGWACGTNTCTRSDPLGPGISYAAITVMVNVAANAASPQVNTVSVSGGNSASANTTDSTTITQVSLPAFFTGEDNLGGGVFYLAFPNGTLFGYYAFTGGGWMDHFDMGYEYVDAGTGTNVYFWDLSTGHWWYTSATEFPYLYDFTLNAWLYYYPAPNNPGHYSTNPRYFVNLTTNVIFTM